MSIHATRLAGLGLAGALAIVPVAGTSALAAGSHGHHAKSATHATHANHGKKTARFTATGLVTAVDAVNGTLTVADKGGSRDLHGTSVTVVVPATAHVTRDDAPATLGDVQVGDHVAVNGTRSTGPVFTAKHVNASAPDTSDSTDG